MDTPESMRAELGQWNHGAGIDLEGLALFCLVTSKVKGYPFEVPMPEGLPVSGVVLADQVKSLDWRARQTEFATRLPLAFVATIAQRLQLLLDER